MPNTCTDAHFRRPVCHVYRVSGPPCGSVSCCTSVGGSSSCCFFFCFRLLYEALVEHRSDKCGHRGPSGEPAMSKAKNTTNSSPVPRENNTSCPISVAAVTGTRLVHCVLLPSRVADSLPLFALGTSRYACLDSCHAKYFSSGRVGCHRRFVCKPHRHAFLYSVGVSGGYRAHSRHT